MTAKTEQKKHTAVPKKNLNTSTLPGGLDLLTSKMEDLEKQQKARKAEALERQQDKMMRAEEKKITDAIAISEARETQKLQAEEQKALKATASARAPSDLPPKPDTKPDPTLSCLKHHPNPKPSPVAKPIAWATDFCRKRRPSEIFNKAFSFTSPSRRRTPTPPISPRTSMSLSCDSDSEPWKRQKRTSSVSSASSATTPTFVSTSTEAHPGCPVTFETPSYTLPSEGAFQDAECDDETYHAYLSSTRTPSWTSLPSPRCTSPTYFLPPATPPRDPVSPSATNFLAHVRASQEARKAMKTPRNLPGVFVDEEMGWGSGEPL
jgi:hypothetical protein